jgi:hypothetical protein
LIAFDDTNVVAFKKVLNKRPRLQSNGFSLPVHRKIKKPFEIKSSRQQQEEYPMDKWIMPPQPQSYLKYADHDYL